MQPCGGRPAGGALWIRRPVHQAMLAHARQARPLEACGLVGGIGRVARCYVRCVNTRGSEAAYAIDPVEILRVLRRFERQGLELLGIFHSHPQSGAYPSATDVAEAHYPDCVYLIAGRRCGDDEISGFRIRDGIVSRVVLAVTDQGSAAP